MATTRADKIKLIIQESPSLASDGWAFAKFAMLYSGVHLDGLTLLDNSQDNSSVSDAKVDIMYKYLKNK